ncbi:MAG: hypothetical protein B1H04_05575 [Planctomycetales bacterium 4484_123]|nr:MAG: hypothetical protein B1H04_05575 [Planctomycetales bacterium 4484_123]
MNLLIIAIDDPGHLDDFLSALVELDVAGLRVLDSFSVMEMLAREAPIFAGLRQLITRPRGESKTILGLTQDDDILTRLDELLKKVGLDFDSSSAGYALLVPVSQWIGHPDLENDS